MLHPNDRPLQPPAFACDDLAATRVRLDAAGLAYGIDEVDAVGQRQLFLTDPSGLAVELNFSR